MPLTAKKFALIIAVLTSEISISLPSDVTNVTSSHRERRAMVFPSGTVLQLSVGLSLPVSVPNRTLTMSVYYQMQYSLPTRASQWYAKPDIIGKREIPNTDLLNVYLPIEEFLEENGYVGRACLLRSICEAANLPFQHENMDILEEIAHEILTPSQEVHSEDAYCSDNNSDVLDNLPLVKQYLAAECLGKSDGDCRIAYPRCPKSPLDMFSQIANLEIFTE